MNQRGSAITALLVAMPLLVACMMVGGATLLLLRDQQKSLQICRTELLRAQQNMLDATNELLGLNPSAAVLRLRRTSAEAAVEATIPIPPAHAAALANLDLVIAQQEILSLTQNALIQKANWQAKMDLYRTQKNLHAEFVGRHFADFQSRQTIPQLDLIKEPAASPTPNYRVKADFAETQVMRIWWSTQTAASLQSWMHLEKSGAAKNLEAQCATTAELNGATQAGGSKWTSRLEKDKPLSSLHLSLF